MHVEKIYRKMGYEHDQEGIIRRFISEEGQWDDHILRTKEFIMKCVSDDKPSSVAVLGSGWLLDVPIEFLSQHCANVYLYDIRHPRQVMHRFRHLRNIQFLTADITSGAVESVYEIMKKPKLAAFALSKLQPNRFNLHEPVDCIISVNLLCQLDILIVEYMRKFREYISDEDLREFRRKIQEVHLEMVSAKQGCLIADYQEMVYDRTDQLISANTHLFANLPECRYSEEWIWNFDTQMTYYPNRKTRLNVKALQF